MGPTWLSLACGAALPVLQTAAVHAEGVTFDLVDLDPVALEYAEGFARALSLGDRVRCTRADLLDLAKLISAVDFRPEGYDLVEMMGFFEFLPDEPHVAGAMTPPSAGDFRATALSLAAPGGPVVFGNMLPTHPQIDFTVKLVQWPRVQPRSEEDLVRLVTVVGVSPEHVTIYTPDDGVYAVEAIKVPGGGLPTTD